MTHSREPWRLYYDGGCNLCHLSKLRVERWADRARQTLVAEVLQSDEALAKGYGDAMTLEADGRVFFAADAWLKLMELAPWFLRWVAILAKIPFIRPLFKWGYAGVARVRYRVFGRRECPLPSLQAPNRVK